MRDRGRTVRLSAFISALPDGFELGLVGRMPRVRKRM